MEIFDWGYLIVSIFIVLFQAVVLPSVFTANYDKEPRISKIRKFIEQLLSSVVGYALLYYLIRKGVYSIVKGQYALFNITDVLLLAISLIGVSGFLSVAIYTVSIKIPEILKK